MTRWLLWIAAGIVLGGIVHLSTILYLPRTATNDAYSRLLLDCMLGDSTLFATDKTVEVAWSLVDPIENAWQKDTTPAFPNYAAGTWGPSQADKLMEEGKWREL